MRLAGSTSGGVHCRLSLRERRPFAERKATMVRAPRSQPPPHPPFGHPLPVGARGKRAGAFQQRHSVSENSSPSPRRGEGWGEGDGVWQQLLPPSPALRAPSPRGGEGEESRGLSTRHSVSENSSPSPRRGEGWGEGDGSGSSSCPPHPPFGHPLPVGARGERAGASGQIMASATAHRPLPAGERDGVRGRRHDCPTDRARNL